MAMPRGCRVKLNTQWLPTHYWKVHMKKKKKKIFLLLWAVLHTYTSLQDTTTSIHQSLSTSYYPPLLLLPNNNSRSSGPTIHQPLPHSVLALTPEPHNLLYPTAPPLQHNKHTSNENGIHKHPRAQSPHFVYRPSHPVLSR